MRENRAEMPGMLLEEFDVKKYERTLRKEGREKGREEGIREGMELSIRFIIMIDIVTAEAYNFNKSRLERMAEFY